MARIFGIMTPIRRKEGVTDFSLHTVQKGWSLQETRGPQSHSLSLSFLPFSKSPKPALHFQNPVDHGE